MKYKDLIEKLAPYAEEEVDICVYANPLSVSFWVNEGEKELITFDVHE